MFSRSRITLFKIVAVVIMGVAGGLPFFVKAAYFSQNQAITVTTTALGMLSFPGEQGVLITSFSTSSYLDDIAAQESAVPVEEEVAIDDRPDRIDAYFSKYKMPLAGYGQTFVGAADECDMDWRLLPAIAVQESSGAKRMIRNNPFGWASARVGFASLEEAIIAVGGHLCGLNPKTQRYYKNKTTYQKLWVYNGSVNPLYPKEVLRIMEKF